MSSEEPTPGDDGGGEPPQETTPVHLAYSGASEISAEDGQTRLAFFGNLDRAPVKLEGTLKKPLRLREALSAIYDIVGSDFRYVPKDRSRYVAFQKLRRETSRLNLWKAQQAYFSWMLRNDPLAFCLLDPIITVHPDRVLFEVFSKDEGSYAQLSLEHSALESAAPPSYGTTNIDFSEALFHGVQQIRSYRPTKLSIGQQAAGIQTEHKGEVLEKQIQLPTSWIRGFLQVQSAATLPHETFSLAPMDLYNVLRHLRMHADTKGKRRGMRLELMPGEKPIIVLEPWETVIAATADIYRGRSAKVVRLWGRRRLMLLKKILPFVESITVHVLGSGLPSFWVMRMGEMTLTLGLTGFTAFNWSQATSLDLLLPRQARQTQELEKIVNHLAKTWFAPLDEIAKAVKLKPAEARQAVQVGCQQGQLMYDLAHDVYRLRPLTNEPLDLPKLEYRNDRDKQAHDLIVRKNAVTVTSENQIFGSGVEITGKVAVQEDNRDYRPQFLLTEDGNVSRAECTCTLFRKQGLKHGPCAHLIGLRLAWTQLEIERATNAKLRQKLTSETRTFSKRDAKGEEVYQISLDRKRIKIHWGRSEDRMRRQTLQYNSEDAARDDYLRRLEDLGAKGYLDATTG